MTAPEPISLCTRALTWWSPICARWWCAPAPARCSALPDALQSYQQVVSVLESRRPVVFCDFDGTLSAIVDDPDSATLIFGAADALKALAELCPVAVLSGRDLADIQQRVGLAGIWYAGSHGFELSAPDGTCHQNEAAAAAVDVLAGAAAELRTQLGDVEGVMVEHKRFAVAVHYRNAAPGRVNRVTAIVHKLASRSGLRVTGGRKVVELRPNVAWDKGKTLGWILQRLAGLGPLLPIYLGDDLIDEDAFDEVRRGGVGIVVRHGEHGDRKSSARFSLENPGAVGTFIKRLARQLAEEQKSATNPWSLTFGGYNPADERLREALADHGKRLYRHARHRARIVGGRCALSGHVQGGPVQPTRRSHRGQHGNQRKPGQPAQLVTVDVPHRRGALVRRRHRRASVVSADPRSAARDADAGIRVS